MDLSKQLKNVGHGTVINYYGQDYFTLERLQSLTNIISENALVTDIMITPYYIFNGKIMELYDYLLSIRVVESFSSRESFLLEETGKQSIEEIDSNVIEKLNNTYFEVKKDNLHDFVKSLEKYMNFMREKESHLLDQTRKELGVEMATNDGIFYEVT